MSHPVDPDRRRLVTRGAIGLLAFQVGGATALLTPRRARADAVPLRALSRDEARDVEALGETLLPGAAEAGLVHFLDQQLSAGPADSLLMIRYLDVPPPYLAFYRACLAAAGGAARRLHGRELAELEPARRTEFVAAMQRGAIEDWRGPPAPLFYFVLRSDAVDVVYGTQEGFEKLGIPYMAHIPPATNW